LSGMTADLTFELVPRGLSHNGTGPCSKGAIEGEAQNEGIC